MDFIKGILDTFYRYMHTLHSIFYILSNDSFYYFCLNFILLYIPKLFIQKLLCFPKIDKNLYHFNHILIIFFKYFIYSKTPLSPSGRGSSAAAQSFSRNVPERSTFHSGMTRNRTRVPYAPGMPTSSQDTSALNSSRPSTFFSKLSSKFSKRYE